MTRGNGGGNSGPWGGDSQLGTISAGGGARPGGWEQALLEASKFSIYTAGGAAG